ncbi:hypothetical protein AKO1_011219 [Acrasis kona]|uniref:Copper transport protein n=1 Tax=Acrasis kona TaxID=1008807 RepID=A0AAW2YYT8_9EUKA
MNMNGTDDMGMKMYFEYGSKVEYVLWKEWSAETPATYAATILAFIFMGFINQLFFLLANTHIHTKIPQPIVAVLRGLAFAANMCVGYFLMLVLMTYNFWLFVALVGGSTIGYIIFSIGLGELVLKKNRISHDRYHHQATVQYDRMVESPKLVEHYVNTY